MMTLFRKIKDLILCGYKISFYSEGMHFYISVKAMRGNKSYSRLSAMPIQDHLEEGRIIECIDWSINALNEDIESQN